MSEKLFKFYYEDIDTSQNERFFLHTHNEYEIYMFFEGDSRYVVEERSYDLAPNDIIIVRKNEMHRVFHNSNTRYHRAVIWVSPKFFKKYGCPEYEEAFLNTGQENKINRKLVFESGLYDAFMRVKKYSNDFTYTDSAVITASVIEVLYLINRITSFDKADQYDKTVKNITTYINNHFTEEISLDTIAEKFYISKYYLCHKFKNATGLTILQYIQQRRLNYAMQLHKSGETLFSSAIAAGFGDYSAFYRAYKKEYKKQPSL